MGKFQDQWLECEGWRRDGQLWLDPVTLQSCSLDDAVRIQYARDLAREEADEV